MIIKNIKIKSPSKKILFQSRIVKQNLSTVQNSQIWKKQLYDSFFFKDRITKGQIQVKQIKKARSSCKAFRNHNKYNTEHNKIDDNNNQYLDNCLKMLSSTKYFQKESLKTKMFKQNSDNSNLKTQQQKINEMIKQKKKIREILTAQINKISMIQFHKYLQNDHYLVDPKVMNLVKNAPNSLTKYNIQKLIDINNGKKQQTEESILLKKRIQRAKLACMYKIEDFHINGQDIFIDKMINRMHDKLKDIGEYLIKPSKINFLDVTHKKRALTNQDPRHKSPKKVDIQKLKIPNLKQNQQLDKVINSLQFKRQPQIQSVQQVRNQIQKKKKNITELSLQQQKLIFFIKNNRPQQVRHMLFQNPKLYDTIDQKQNNLLHICAKNNSSQIFNLVGKSAKGYKLLNQKNHLKRKPYDLVKIMGSKQLKERAIQAIQFQYNL